METQIQTPIFFHSNLLRILLRKLRQWLPLFLKPLGTKWLLFQAAQLILTVRKTHLSPPPNLVACSLWCFQRFQTRNLPVFYLQLYELMIVDPPGECKHCSVSSAATVFPLQSMKTALSKVGQACKWCSLIDKKCLNSQWMRGKKKYIHRGNTQWPCSKLLYKFISSTI